MTEQASLGDVSESKSEKSSAEEAPELISGVAWSKIEGFPENWEANELDGDVDLQTGNNFPSENFVDEGGLPLIRIRDLPTGEPETNYKGEYDEQHVIEPQDLLVGMDGEFKPYLWEGEKALLNQRVLKIESEKYNKFFLRYALDKPLRYIQKSIAGTTVKHLSQKNVKKINLPTADIDEQRRIASVLYNVDQAISKTEEIIEQTQRVKKGLIQDILRLGVKEDGGLRSEKETEFQETHLGELPSDWKLVRADKVCSDVVDCPHSTPEYTDEGPIVIRTSEIEGGEFIESEAPRTTQEDYEHRISRLEPQKGDVVFTREAPIGEAFKISKDREICLGQRTMILRPERDKLDPDFLVHTLYSPHMQKRIHNLSRGSTSEHMNVGDVRKFEIPIPPKDEQKRIVEYLENINDKLNKEKEQKEQLQRLKKGLMQDLLTGSVRTGEDVRVLDEVVEVEG